jgi:hypothetical protein
MQDPQNSSLDVASLSAVTTAVFRQAAFEQRDRLNISELGTLLSSLAIRFKVHTAPVGESPAVDLRISLNNTREFGMVLSAGLGGPDAELDESNFRKDRASVYAAAELTDADDFLRLFSRTLTYQRLTGKAKRDKLPIPDEQLKTCFERMLAVWDELFPAEQSRIIQLLIERVVISPTGIRIDMTSDGMKDLIHSAIVEPTLAKAA